MGDPNTPTERACPECGGSGSVRAHGHEDYGVSFECDECSECRGTGKAIPPGTVVIDCCPGCEEPDTTHMLDAPHHCQCGIPREEFVPLLFVPLLFAPTGLRVPS